MDTTAWLTDLATISDPVALVPRVTSNPADAWQHDFLTCTDDFVLVLASRGVGKSTTVAILAYQRAEMWPEQTILLIAPALRQSEELFRKVIDVRRGFGATQISTRETLQIIELRNGSRVIAAPASSDTIRGYRADLIVLDEAARVPDDEFGAVVPMLKDGGRLIGCTTPAGRRGWFFERWQARVGRQIIARSMDLPRMKRIVARDRQIMSPTQFRTEHELAFAGSGDAFFDLDDVAAMFTPSVRALDLRMAA